MCLAYDEANTQPKLTGAWWKHDTAFADCSPGQPCDVSHDNKALFAWLLLTLRAQICIVSLSLYQELHKLPKTPIEETERPYSSILMSPSPTNASSHIQTTPPTPAPTSKGSLIPQGSKLFCSSCDNNKEAFPVSHHFKVCAYTFPHLS